MSNRGRWATISVALMCLGLAGCGGGADAPQPVSGKVSVKGGAALTKGTIRFTNSLKAKSASGPIGADGTFQLSSLGTNDGALVGDYTVTVSGTETGGYDKPDEPVTKPIHDKYESDSTTDLKYSVKLGKNVCNFELDPPAAAAPAQ